MPPDPPGLKLPATATAVAIAAASYAVAFGIHFGPAAILIALPCLCLLARLGTARRAFYTGLAAGLLIYSPQLWFFTAVFGPPAVLLFFVAAFPIALFVLLSQQARRRFSPAVATLLIPVLWTGIEFFRSELYYLKFAWVLPGQVAAFLPGARWLVIGVYGLGFVYVLAGSLLVGPNWWFRSAGIALSIACGVLMYVPARTPTASTAGPRVAGVQLELVGQNATVEALDNLAADHPEADILVLAEYAFQGPVPEAVRAVAVRHHRYLVVGAVHEVPHDQFYDAAVVIDPKGDEVFWQAKSVPVQFMTDGLAAADRRVWDSPWGKIGLAVCYDISYARPMDDFVRQGARGLIIPTMDLTKWGEYERRQLHGRMAPVRSAEYGIPVFSVWSSGVSQLTDRQGRVIATAGYPGQGETIAGQLDLSREGHVPYDRPFAWAAVAITAGLIIYFIAVGRRPGRVFFGDGPTGRAAVV
jgi:apolipoprotein N-acyltransferase